VDDSAREERLVTVHEPDSDRWSADFVDTCPVTISEECGNGRRRPALRARVAEKGGRTALVLGVPVEVCDSCGQVWMTTDVAKPLDELFTTMLASDVEVATRLFGSPPTAAQSI
jgi:YgiT-type zinc finger domain-containing protein